MTEFSPHHEATDFDVFHENQNTIHELDIDDTVRKWSYNISGLITEILHVPGSRARADKKKEIAETLKPIIEEVVSTHIQTDTPLPTSLREWKQASFESHEDYVDFVNQFQPDSDRLA
jgi:hypothetical protein